MINKATLIGNVGTDPEIRTMQNGDKVANFSLATSERWKNKATGEQKERTEWHRIAVWGNLVSVVENYVHKGSKLYLEGEIRTRYWEQDGQKRYITEIVLQGFGAVLKLLDSKQGRQPNQHEQAEQDAYQPQPGTEDDIPF